MRAGLRGGERMITPNAAMMYFTQWRGRVFLVVASLSLMAPLLPLYCPNRNGLNVTGYPIARDFINVWSGPRLAFRAKVKMRCFNSCAVAKFRAAGTVDGLLGLTVDEPMASIRGRQQPGPNA
jgi:hypothetical protein